jgi:hypothetical protein
VRRTAHDAEHASLRVQAQTHIRDPRHRPQRVPATELEVLYEAIQLRAR